MTPDQRRSVGLSESWEADMAATMGVPWPPAEEHPDG